MFVSHKLLFAINQQFLPYHCHLLTSLPQVKNSTNFHVFCLSFTLTDLSGNMGFLQRVQKVTSVGYSCLILIHVVYFDYDCMTTNFLGMHCYFPVIRLVNFV